MTPRTGRLAAILIVVMTLVPAFAPWASVLGATVNTFSGGAYSKDIAIPPGGGDDMSVALTLPARSTVKRLSMTLTPHPVDYNTSFMIPANGTFAQGTYDADWMSAGNDGLSLRSVSFTNEERFWNYKGLDNTSTTANVLIEEGLEGVALWPQNSTNLTYIGESKHGVDAIASFSFDGRLIKNLTLNATGTTQFGSIWATIRLWNNQTMQWATPVNNVNIGATPNHYVLVDAGYNTPVYSKLEVRITPTWAAGTRNMWFNYNITTQAFMPSSIVTSALLDPVMDHGWKESWLIENCSVQADKVVPAGTAINLSLSNDNGTTWQNVTGAELIFDNAGNDLRWRAELTSDKDNTTPVLRSVSLVCWRQMPQTEFGYQSRVFTVREGSFVSYSLVWSGNFPQGTTVSGIVKRDSSDPDTRMNSGQVGNLAYDTMLQKIAFYVILTGNATATPVMADLMFNYTVEVRPSDIGLDVGDDGVRDWNMTGDLKVPLMIQAPNSAKMIAALNAFVPAQGTADVPIRVSSKTSGTVTLSDLVLEYGLPPTLRAAIPEINISEDKPQPGALFLDAYFTDDYDAGLLGYTVPYMEDPAKVLATVNGSRIDLALPTKDWFGNSKFRVRATDSDGSFVESNDITVNVAPVNDPPLITYVPSDIIGYVGVDLMGKVAAADADGDELTFRLDVRPSSATIGQQDGIIEWRPAAAGPQAFRVNVSDDMDWTSKDFTISAVLDMTKASAPAFTTKPLIEARVGALYRYEVAAIDLDGDVLEYSLLSGPSGMVINSTDGVVLWTPAMAHIGYQNVTIRVTDGGFNTDQVFRVLVLNSVTGNKLPQISSSPTFNAWVGQPYVYSVKAIDPDPGTVLWYQLAQGPKAMSLDDGGRLVWVPTSNDLGDHSVQVVVTDGVAQVPQGWTLKVHASERTCVISTPADYQVVKDTLLVTGLAFGPGNLTRVEVRVGKEEWRVATGLTQWGIEIDLKGRSTGYYYVKARACDSVTCSKEASVRIYHQGKGEASSGLNIYWWAAIVVIIAIIALLVVDLKFRFIRRPDERANKVASDEDLEGVEKPTQRGRGQYRERDR